MKYTSIILLAALAASTNAQSFPGITWPNDDGTCDNPVGCWDPACEYDENGFEVDCFQYEGNPNCADMGYQFGWKDEGCFPSGGPIPFEEGEQTFGLEVGTGDYTAYTPAGQVTITCHGGKATEWQQVGIEATVDTIVIIKGSNGGAVYNLTAHTSHLLDVVGVGMEKVRAISHIEFCFRPEEEAPPIRTEPVPAVKDPCFEDIPIQDQACNFEGACPYSAPCCEGSMPEPVSATCRADGKVDIIDPCLSITCPVVPEPEEPAPEEPAPEEPAGEEPAAEEPAGEEPAAEEPAVEEPTVEEPAVEEPAVEEPAPEAPPATSTSTASGDPHFKTWSGDKFDYHGECDLVLVDNPTFANGLGLKVHIRTTRFNYYSFIERVGIQIGDETLEFDNDVENFLINGLPVEANRKHHKTMLADFVVRRDVKAISIRLDEKTKAKIDLIHRKTGFPTVRLDGGGTDIFNGSLGLLGDWSTGKRLARDGETEINDHDATAFALEWQVRDTEPLLFQDARFPQFPTICTPPKKAVGGRIGSSHMQAAAEEACAHWEEDKEDCIFDVIATRDFLVAEEGHHSTVG